MRQARAAITLTRTVRSPKRPWLVLAIAVAVVALPAVASGALSAPAAPSAGTQTYQDSSGENPAAPDISTITVSNDDAATITFRVNVTNRPQYASDILGLLFIDSDANQATGDQDNFGTDYVIQLAQGEVLLFKWDGSDYTLSATQASLNYAWANGPTFRINAADLGNTRKFTFNVLLIAGATFDPTTGALDCTNCAADGAPAVGLYTYQLQITKPTLIVKSLKPTPA
ncbi:MAG TPA: hypothetical protein VFS37_03435, partial [Conexibacter sp.]|nr:hypothetical protein [Conexibacter sp.]